MTKTADFGVPTKAATPGTCRICGAEDDHGPNARSLNWVDETKTLCGRSTCIAAARAEIVAKPEQTADITRPYTGQRYGFAPL